MAPLDGLRRHQILLHSVRLHPHKVLVPLLHFCVPRELLSRRDVVIARRCRLRELRLLDLLDLRLLKAGAGRLVGLLLGDKCVAFLVNGWLLLRHGLVLKLSGQRVVDWLVHVGVLLLLRAELLQLRVVQLRWGAAGSSAARLLRWVHLDVFI